MDLNGKAHKTLVYQHSTALEPYTKDTQSIYYANVSCVEGCGKIIQEVWRKDIASGQAKQLTLLNTLSHQPSVDSKKEWMYFSSNSKGSYHIWRTSLNTGSVKQLTYGDVTDGFPMSYTEGILFLRRINNQVKLMHLDNKGDLSDFKLPKTYQKIRNLKVK
jgi:Tol biopolymer transport system component